MQEALETTRWSLVSLSWLTPKTTVRSAPSDGRGDEHALGAGGQMRRGLVARGEDAGAFQRDVDAEVPVRQLRRVLDRGDLDLAAADVDRVAVDRRPNAGSGRARCRSASRWALVSTGPRSLIATTSMSVRPDSTIARRPLRPMRPKPLIATLTAIAEPPLALRAADTPIAGASRAVCVGRCFSSIRSAKSSRRHCFRLLRSGARRGLRRINATRTRTQICSAANFVAVRRSSRTR